MVTGAEDPALVVTTTDAVPVAAPAGRAPHGNCTLSWSAVKAGLNDLGTILIIGAGRLLTVTLTFASELESGTVSNWAKAVVKLFPKMVMREPGATAWPCTKLAPFSALRVESITGAWAKAAAAPTSTRTPSQDVR